MQDFRYQFLEHCIENNILTFGEFTLKSGRVSPYFFNAGRFCVGESLAQLGRFYAHAIRDSRLRFDMLFGPAYKGIPLAAAVAIAYADFFGENIPFCYDRKEAKTHGEGGQLIGAPLSGRVLIIDDVLSAGTATREAVAKIDQANAETVGLAVALDRQEVGQHGGPAAAELASEFHLQVISIATLDDLIEHLDGDATREHYQDILAYRARYGG